jgi:hypothetical protein
LPLRYSLTFISNEYFYNLLIVLILSIISHHFEGFTVATMIWLTVMEYLCHKWPRICPTCRKHFPVLSSFTTYYSYGKLCTVFNLIDFWNIPS